MWRLINNRMAAVPHSWCRMYWANAGGSAGWADVANIIPWNMYLAYGDKRILEINTAA
jgi:alpha-L-rhamnosidase